MKKNLKIKDLYKENKSNTTVKLVVGGTVLTPVAIPLFKVLESKLYEQMASISAFGNKEVFLGAGISNWYMLGIYSAIVTTGICQYLISNSKKGGQNAN